MLRIASRAGGGFIVSETTDFFCSRRTATTRRSTPRRGDARRVFGDDSTRTCFCAATATGACEEERTMGRARSATARRGGTARRPRSTEASILSYRRRLSSSIAVAGEKRRTRAGGAAGRTARAAGFATEPSRARRARGATVRVGRATMALMARRGGDGIDPINGAPRGQRRRDRASRDGTESSDAPSRRD